MVTDQDNIRFLMIMSVLAKCLLYSVLKLYGEAWFLSHLDITVKRAASYPKQRINYHDYCWRVLYRPITQQDDSWRIAVITVISGLHTNEAKVSALLCIDLFVSLYAFSNKRIFDRRLNCNTRHCFAQSFTSRKDKLSICSQLTIGSWHVNSNCNAGAF